MLIEIVINLQDMIFFFIKNTQLDMIFLKIQLAVDTIPQWSPTLLLNMPEGA